MELSIQQTDGIARLALSGKLDAKGAEAIENQFIIATKEHDKVAVDLSGVDYIASIGIRMFVMAGKSAARRGGKIIVFGASPQVAKVIMTAGLTEIVPQLDDWATAIAALA